MKTPELIFTSQDECEVIIEELNRLFEHRPVSVGDLNDLVGRENVYTDHQWGWIDKNVVSIKQVGDGWQIVFPDPKRI
jgi:hypothetical protein